MHGMEIKKVCTNKKVTERGPVKSIEIIEEFVDIIDVDDTPNDELVNACDTYNQSNEDHENHVLLLFRLGEYYLELDESEDLIVCEPEIPY